MRISKTYQSSVFKDNAYKEPPVKHLPKTPLTPPAVQSLANPQAANLNQACPDCANCLLHKFKSAREVNSRRMTLDLEQKVSLKAQKEANAENEYFQRLKSYQKQIDDFNGRQIERKRSNSVNNNQLKELEKRKTDADFYDHQRLKKEQIARLKAQRLHFANDLNSQVETRSVVLSEAKKEEQWRNQLHTGLALGNKLKDYSSSFQVELKKQVLQQKEQNEQAVSLSERRAQKAGY